MITQIEIIPAKLNHDDAHRLTCEIKAATESIWSKVKLAHDGCAWSALGYPSWREYVKQEFQMSKQHAFRLLNYANVREALEESPMGDSMPNERTARPLTKLPPAQRAKAYHEAVAASPTGKPTAREVQAVVSKASKPANKDAGEAPSLSTGPLAGKTWLQTAIYAYRMLKAEDSALFHNSIAGMKSAA